MERDIAEQLFRNLFKESCASIFGAMDCDARCILNDSFAKEIYPTSEIDGGGQDYELVLTLCFPYSALRACHPIREQAAILDEGALEDWQNEMANRLLGLLKAELRHHQCSLQTGLPNCHLGDDLEEQHPEKSFYYIHYQIGEDPCEMSIGLEWLKESVAIEAKIEADKDEVSAGEIDFF